jgi:hypothetical protein
MKKIVILLSFGFLIIFVSLFITISQLLPDIVPVINKFPEAENKNKEQNTKSAILTDEKANNAIAQVKIQSDKSVVIDSPDLTNFLDAKITLKGKAPGVWFKDGVLTINLLESSGKKIAVSYAGSEGIWTSESEVNFNAEFEYLPPSTEDGLIVFVDAENKAQHSIPVRFRATISGAGETCATSEDCVLPANYAIRSICPYKIECLYEKCTVVCPNF